MLSTWGGVVATYADLAAALGVDGANVPVNRRQGGMTVKFVLTSDNKYVQYRLMSDTFNTTVANWQGIDDELIQLKTSDLKSWILSESYSVQNVTYADGIVVSPVNVTWPDGNTGTLSITRDGDGLVSSIVATHDGDSYTLTIERNSDGNVINTTITKNN